MSCGNHHETSCTEVLARVYSYLDGELDDSGCGEVKDHLEECGPCLREYGLEEVVKKLVNRHCGCDPVPGDLRSKVLGRIQQIRAMMETRGDLSAMEAGDIEVLRPGSAK